MGTKELVAAVAIIALTSPAISSPNSTLTAGDVLQQTLAAYAKAKTLSDIDSIEHWCRDNMKALDYSRDSFVLNRALTFSDQSKVVALMKTAAALNVIEDEEGNLLCAPGALQ